MLFISFNSKNTFRGGWRHKLSSLSLSAFRSKKLKNTNILKGTRTDGRWLFTTKTFPRCSHEHMALRLARLFTLLLLQQQFRTERERGFVTSSPPRDGWMGWIWCVWLWIFIPAASSSSTTLLRHLTGTCIYTSSLFLWMLIVDILIGLQKGTVGRDCCEESENKSLSKRTGPAIGPSQSLLWWYIFFLSLSFLPRSSLVFFFFFF